MYNDWFNTGDIGYMDRENELHVVSRSDDMVIINSHKLYLNDIAEIIQRETKTSECFVSVLNLNDNQTLCCLYSANFEINREIISKLKLVLLTEEIPRYFVRISSMPRTLNGKIDQNNAKKILINKLQSHF